ncbi:MAG: hypothetical protein IJP34_03320 [Clostridia bacterium]|nr:hypothetical protein [Clostridia bacterium]
MKGQSVLKFFLMLLAAVFVINQLLAVFYKPIKTENAVYYTACDGLDITGVIVRNETLISYSGGGVMHFVVSDGNRVAKNGVIANIYDSEADSLKVSERQDTEQKIAEIEEILGYNDIDTANLDLMKLKIDEQLNELILNSASGDFYDVKNYSNELLTAIWRRQAAMGENTDFSSQLESLKAKLNNSLPSPKQLIRSDKSGYFVSTTDGYENVLTADNISKITPEFLDDVTSEEKPSDVIGKIVSDYDWYIAAKVSVDESLKYKEGEILKLKTAIKSSPELKVTVKRINTSEIDENAVIIFSCNEMNSELASMRSGPMTIIKNEYSGLRVPRKALRVVDSVRGVYVLSGMQVKFVPVNMIYSNDSYIICEKVASENNELRLYDRVIVKGKKLYDGKIIG